MAFRPTTAVARARLQLVVTVCDDVVATQSRLIGQEVEALPVSDSAAESFGIDAARTFSAV